ncbi:ABC transporter substrate-binding protein [Bordetella sp. N]|nr:ABC transporter substrate-binding protein [Bordetella sp. N]
MQSRHRDRRTFLKSAAGLALAPALPLVPGMARAAGGDVVVGTWGGDYQNFLQQFIGPTAKQLGLDVVFDTGNAVPRMTKLKAEKNSRRGSMDVALLGDLDMYDVARSECLHDVTAKQVPNLANVYEQFKTPYSIPHIFSAMVLVYNKEKFKTAPDSFNVALDPAYKGRTGFSDILFNFNGIFVGLAAGGDTKSFEPGKKFLSELVKNQPRVYPSNEAVAAAFKSGEIWMACMWKARALQWRDAGLPLEFVIPKEGAIPVTFEGGLARNSRNAESGWKYLNAMLDPAGQLQFAKAMGYAPTVHNAQLPPDLQARVGFTDDEIKRIHKYDLKALVDSKNDFLDYWNKEFKAKI